MALGSELQEVSVTALPHRIGFAGFAVAAGLIFAQEAAYVAALFAIPATPSVARVAPWSAAARAAPPTRSVVRVQPEGASR